MNELLTKQVLEFLLNVDLQHNAQKFRFISKSKPNFSREFLIQSIMVLEELSHDHSEESDRYLIAISALVWTYAKDEWFGLSDYLILFLTRRGFGPTATMLDENYSTANNFRNSSSIINQFAVTMNQLKYEIRVGGQTFLITSFQKQVWEALDKHPLVGISAPTSAGKSFIILLKMMDVLIKKAGNVIFIVPTLSLVSQVALDIKKLLHTFQLDYSVETGYNQQKLSLKQIYVLTQERAITSFSQNELPFVNVQMLVVDEIQNVERVNDSNDQRAKILFDLMIEMRNSISIEKTVISGPRVNDIDILGKDIFGIDGYKAATKSSPVLNVTYSIKKTGKEYIFKQYCDLTANPIHVKIANKQIIDGYGGSMYTKKYLGFLSAFMYCFDADETNIIFSPTTGAARKMAVELRKDAENKTNPYLKELSDYLAETVHEIFSLCDTVLSGIVYHHGKLPHHVRNAIEDGIKKQQVRNVICTTTLLQGVNLPVKNIIIRNPNLFVTTRNGSPKLTSYETANLRGRAGRLLKDFVGRTFIMDEDSFTPEQNQTTLFENTEKTIKVGYKEKFDEYKTNIINDLNAGRGQESSNNEYSYLLTYIRQAVLKYENDASAHMRNVGIVVDDKFVEEQFRELSSLSVSKEVCLANRYWDPLDLDKLNHTAKNLSIPTGAAENDLAQKLNAIVMHLKETFPVYYLRFFKVNESDNFDHLLNHCKMAESWLKERPLKQILSARFYDSDDKIEDAITMLQNKISFGLPMLLKPLYDIRVPDSTFLKFIEMGAYRPIVRRLIEMNIPRETSIYLANNFDLGDPENVGWLKSSLSELSTSLPYFHRLQLQYL